MSQTCFCVFFGVIPYAHKLNPPKSRDNSVKCLFLCLFPCLIFLPQYVGGPEKAHRHLVHKQFPGHPSHQSSQPGIWTKVFMCLNWVPHTANTHLKTGRPVRRHPPPQPMSHRITLLMFMCLFFSQNTLRAQSLKCFKSNIEMFKRTTRQTPFFVGNSQGQD